jgi:hypothetical protein
MFIRTGYSGEGAPQAEESLYVPYRNLFSDLLQHGFKINSSITAYRNHHEDRRHAYNARQKRAKRRSTGEM